MSLFGWFKTWEQNHLAWVSEVEKRLEGLEAKTAEVVAKEEHVVLQKAHNELVKIHRDLTIEYLKAKTDLEFWKNKFVSIAETVRSVDNLKAPPPVANNEPLPVCTAPYPVATPTTITTANSVSGETGTV